MALIAFNAPCAVRPFTLTTSRRTWAGRVLTGAGLALLPWMGYLAGTLPPTEAAAWVALDAVEAACLLVAGTRLMNGRSGHRAAAAAAAVLLVTDAYVDVVTAGPGSELLGAVAMAVGAELPLAALCGVLAARAVR
ncbi:hypothetical protein [Streptomyces chrestomyceticus]|uniref:hypothetical protein n=1 Tax=Streptomyces chrestomyceticus TaxID=68185 RepID=UPI0019D0BEE1|nr:hypothetical protein [Streptomyces chrestomyceticus]